MVGGSFESMMLDWMNEAQIYDGIDTLSIEEAQSLGWLQGRIYYFDENEQYYKIIPRHHDYISPWRGYWIYSNQPDLQLVLPIGFIPYCWDGDEDGYEDELD